MLGGKNKNPLGYTIVEVMIVLAVSGVMFVIAASFINGKQEKASFTSGVNEMATNIQSVLDQVTNGQYSDIDLGCNATSTGTIIGGTTTSQGTNNTCVFLGKLMHFSVGGDPTKYEVLSIAGGRLSSEGASNNLSAAHPVILDDLTTNANVPQSLQISSMQVDGSANYTIGFFQSQGQSDGAGGAATGAQTLTLQALSSSNDANESSFKYSSGFVINASPAQSANICVTDGSQNANIFVGDNSNTSALSVTVKMDGSGSCS